MVNNEKLSCCAFIFCPGRTFCADQSCFVCGAVVHASCFVDVAVGQNYTPGNFYCSVQCIRYDNDVVKAKRETLLANSKMQLRKLAHGVGAKISYRPPGQGSKDLMFCEEVMEVSSQCGSAATHNELDTNMVGSNSLFWNKVASLFHSQDGCDPGSDSVDFLDKVHFEHTYYVEHHESIDPSKHVFFLTRSCAQCGIK
jgi:hypothetical protein